MLVTRLGKPIQPYSLPSTLSRPAHFRHVSSSVNVRGSGDLKNVMFSASSVCKLEQGEHFIVIPFSSIFAFDFIEVAGLALPDSAERYLAEASAVKSRAFCPSRVIFDMFVERLEEFGEICLRYGEHEQDLWGSVQPPASEHAILEAEDRLGVALPAELRQIYSEANGGMWFGHAWLEVERLSRWRNEIDFHSPVPASELVMVVSAHGGIFVDLSKAPITQLLVAHLDEERIVPFFPTTTSYFDFHINMARAGFVVYEPHVLWTRPSDGKVLEYPGWVILDRHSPEAKEWMAANGHPHPGAILL